MPDVLPSSPTGDVYSKQLNASPLKIGFLGLGTIGSAIVSNLLKTGHEVTVWNRTMSKVLPCFFLKSRSKPCFLWQYMPALSMLVAVLPQCCPGK